MGTARLEYALARLAMAVRGWDDDKQLRELMRPGRVRGELRKLAAEHADWKPLLRVWRDCQAVLDDRNSLMHAVAVTTTDDLGETKLEFWHVPSDSQVSIGPAAVREHAGDIDRCFRQVVRLISEAGAVSPSRYGILTADVHGSSGLLPDTEGP